jgi:hypothetical protein
MEEIANRWWKAQELLDRADAIRTATSEDEFFCDSRYKKAREAMVSATFARWRPWNRDWLVRLVPEVERFPDAELKSGDDVRSFEIVEADKEGRRRCEEYRKARGELESFDSGEEAGDALESIVRVVAQKARKKYNPKPNLLVYVNFDSGEPTSLYASGLSQRFGKEFQSAWLVWLGKHPPVRLWPNPARIKAS